MSATEMAVYRMGASGVELLKPVLLWLHDPELRIPTGVADQVISATESWVIRRQLLRLNSGDLGRVVADLIRTYRTSPAEELASRVSTYLTRLVSTSTYWPGDEEIQAALLTENAYRRFPRGRLRMLLEAVEDRQRAVYGYPPVPRRGYPIEHVLPQKWEEHWPVDGLEEELQRGAHVHRLGNLTLLTKSLNSAVSNGPWQKKREKLAKYDVLLLNRPFADSDTQTWDEGSIDARSAEMITSLLATWSVPEGHSGEIVHAVPSDQAWVEVKHLIAAGLLAAGTRLTPRPGQWQAAEAIVRHDGRLEVGGQTFDTPSGAGKHVKGAVTNGWWFWRLEDGRKLADVRAAYRGEKADRKKTAPFDWSRLHAILESLPDGRWTSYSDLADAVGTAPQPLGGHITSCQQCANAHRVLTHDGRVAEAFRWSDPNDTRQPVDLLLAEGLAMTDGKADPSKRLSSDELTALVAESD